MKDWATELKSTIRKNSLRHMQGQLDLYVYLLRGAIPCSTRRGCFGIFANKFMHANYGKPLRKVIATK